MKAVLEGGAAALYLLLLLLYYSQAPTEALFEQDVTCVYLRTLYSGTSLTRKHTPLAAYRRPMPRVLGGSWGDGCFFMGEVALYTRALFLRHHAC